MYFKFSNIATLTFRFPIYNIFNIKAKLIPQLDINRKTAGFI